MAEQIKNINFNLNTKQKFTVDGDTNKVIELDVTDINIVNRYSEAMHKLKEFERDYNKINQVCDKIASENKNPSLSTIDEFSESIKELEQKIRDLIDYIFDSKVCDTILGKSSAFARVDKSHAKYEQILQVLSQLYLEDAGFDINKLNDDNINKITKGYVK